LKQHVLLLLFFVNKTEPGSYSVGPLVSCLAAGSPPLQEKAIEILSRLCLDQSDGLGDMISGTSGCIAAIAGRIIKSTNIEVKAGGTALLICAAKVHKKKSMEALNEANLSFEIIQCLVEMLGSGTLDMGLDNNSHESEVERDRNTFKTTKERQESDSNIENFTATTSGSSVAIWLLSVMASHDSKSKFTITEVGAIEILTERISQFSSQVVQVIVLSCIASVSD
jgi:hypothetical protein